MNLFLNYYIKNKCFLKKIHLFWCVHIIEQHRASGWFLGSSFSVSEGECVFNMAYIPFPILLRLKLEGNYSK